jgi:hypothetical protein
MTEGLKSNPEAPPGVPSWAVKGAKVVCVNDDPHLDPDYDNDESEWVVVATADDIKEGHIYTIRWVGADFDGALCVWLEEIVRPALGAPNEPGYYIDRFRPLVTRSLEQDISHHFRHHLQNRVDA